MLLFVRGLRCVVARFEPSPYLVNDSGGVTFARKINGGLVHRFDLKVTLLPLFPLSLRISKFSFVRKIEKIIDLDSKEFL